MPTALPTAGRCSARQVRVLLGDGGLTPLDRLVDDVDEPHRLAAAALQHLAVRRRARCRTATCSARAGGTSQPAIVGDGEDHRQVLRLRRADDVEQPRRADPLDAVDDAGQVARGVREGAGAAAHDQRQRLALAVREPGREHDLGAVGLLQQPGASSRSSTSGHQRLVAALARRGRRR